MCVCVGVCVAVCVCFYACHFVQCINTETAGCSLSIGSHVVSVMTDDAKSIPIAIGTLHVLFCTCLNLREK